MLLLATLLDKHSLADRSGVAPHSEPHSPPIMLRVRLKLSVRVGVRVRLQSPPLVFEIEMLSLAVPR